MLILLIKFKFLKLLIGLVFTVMFVTLSLFYYIFEKMVLDKRIETKLRT